MMKSGFDASALADLFAQASTKQGEALRKAASEATLKALQGRELTLENIRKALKQVTDATSAGAAKNLLPNVDVQALLGKAVAGMDAAVLQTVQAHRKALQQFVDQGIGLQQEQMKKAMADVEKMEQVFFNAIGSSAKGADAALQGPWKQVLESMKSKGTETGMQAASSIEQLTAQAQTALREGRSAGLRNAQALMKGYAALVSGVLIGMSDALQPQQGAPASKARKRR
jgi:light-regulated signal transduction histidine kinase (bacteriophytochrome)